METTDRAGATELPNIGNGPGNMPEDLSPVQIQQEYFENLGECDWVKYDKPNRNFLVQNIAFAMYGSPNIEGDLSALISNHILLEGYTSRQKEQVMKVYEKICEQSKYSFNGEDIVMSVILVVCAKPYPLKMFQIQPSDYWVDLHLRNDIIMWCTPVFKIRKCIPTTAGAKCCRVYIDDNARVYKTWDSYLTNNTQPKCVLIVPKNGEYSGTIVEHDKGTFLVSLSVWPSPSLGVKARVLSSVDAASTVASLGAIGVIGVAAFTPVAPVVLAGAAVATIATGVYGLVRSSLHLHDRTVHEQTISPTDSEARGSWINIAASSVGLVASGASTLLSRSAAAGTNITKTGQVLAVSVDVLRHANILTGGVGVVNSLFYIILKYRRHGEKPTTLELFQFTSATLFFCSAVMSNRTAQNIIEESQAQTINEYRSTLRSNRHRKMFDKISAESRRTQGHIQGNTEVIRGIKNIANKDQFFADVLRINKDVNQHNLRISMTSDGRVNLNAQHRFDPSELSGIGSSGRSELFSTLGSAPAGPPNVPTRLAPTPNTVSTYGLDSEEENPSIMVGIRPDEVLRVGTLLVRISTSGAENIAKLLENLSQEAHANLMTIAFNILSKLIPEEITKMRFLCPEGDLVVQIVKFVFDYMKHKRPLGDSQYDDNGIIIVLREFFQDGLIRQETILHLKNRFMAWVEQEIDQRREQYPHRNVVVCELCHGIRYS